jgi:hypothetical protein
MIGPSDLDLSQEGDLAKLPGVVVHFRNSAFAKGDGEFYFFYRPPRRT